MIRIFLIDDEEAQLPRYARILGDAFKDVGATVEINQCLVDITQPEKSLAEIEEKITRNRPHVIIADNKIENYDQAWGQFFLAKMKKILPDTVTCLLTRESVKPNQFGLRTPNPDIIIDKNQVGGSPAYRRYVGERVLGLLTRSAALNISWITPFQDLFARFRDEGGRRISLEEVQSIIEQCLYDGSISDATKSIALEALPGGKSGAVVMSCQLTGVLRYGVTGVIKISRKQEALRESRNYNTYVKWVLPYTWKVEVLGTGFTEGAGAVCYSFAFEGDGKPQSSSAKLRKSDRMITPLICDTIFSPNSKAWYSERRTLRRDASEYFQSKPFFPNPEAVSDREERLTKMLAEKFGNKFRVVDEEWELFGRRAIRPGRILFTEDWGYVEECVCHGDLNANNILVNPKTSGVAFIDFQKTGYHNIYRDFISYESSLRIDWGEGVDPSDLGDLLAAEIALAEGGTVVTSGYLMEVQQVRKAAFANFPELEGERAGVARRALFLFAAHIHYSWLALRFNDFPPEAYPRLLLGAFAALEVLGRTRLRLVTTALANGKALGA
jgi:hypothetical protein